MARRASRQTPQIPKCWICGDAADSSEHIFKARDLKKLFDRDGFKFDNLPFHFAEGGSVRIPGPKSKRIKYAPLICQKCNNQRTAAPDLAYDQMSDWFSVSQQDGGAPELDVSDVFGGDWLGGIEQFRRFCAKSLGCRILAADCILPACFPNPVSGKNMEMLAISICRTQPFHTLPNYTTGMGDEFLGKGDLLASISKSHLEQTGERKIRFAIWWENVGNFQINHWFAIRPHPRLGAALDGSQAKYQIISNDFDLPKMKEQMWEWLSLGEPLYSGMDRYTRPLATTAWSAYLASRTSDAPPEIQDLMTSLRDAIQSTKLLIDAEVLAYRTHADLDGVMAFFMANVTSLLKITAQALGYFDRFVEAPTSPAEIAKGSYFESSCRAIHAALNAMFDLHLDGRRQAALENEDDLSKAVWALCATLGFVLHTADEGQCYVSIPPRPDNAPAEMLVRE